MKENPTKTDGVEPTAGASQPNRRQVLKSLGLAAAPLVLPARLLAQKTASADAPPPSERLSIALVGLGGAMDRQVRNLLTRNDLFLHAVCDVDQRRIESSQVDIRRAHRKEIAEFRDCSGTQDHREIMAREDIDAVVIATPVHWHAAIAIDAIRAGKDVLIQSPMTLTIREGKLVEQAARQHGAIVQCVAPQRCEGQFVKMCEMVRNGYLGEIKQVYTQLSYFREPMVMPVQTVPKELDYDRWLGPATWQPYHSGRVSGGRVSGWRNFWDYGLRTHGESGFDRYDLIQWALGKEDTGPVEFTPREFAGETYAAYRYKDGPTVRIGHPVEAGQEIEFVGNQGRLWSSSKGILGSDPVELSRLRLATGDVRLPIEDVVETSWIDSVKTRSNPVVDASVGHRSSSICNLSAIADRIGRVINWDPEKQEIVGDPLAARMLDRPRRAPYTLV